MATNTQNTKLDTSTKIFLSQAIREIIDDPDFGMELTDQVKNRLSIAKKGNYKTTSLSKIAKRNS
jgi:hypothetical protein